MKKIISGYFYRLIKGFEIWLLIGLFIASSLFFMIRQTGSNIITRSDDIVIEKDNFVIKKEDIRDHCFENLNISAKDLYRCCSEPIPEQSFKIIRDNHNFAEEEYDIFEGFIQYINIFPTAIMLLFIPVFFGRMFSDKTIKNLISCGLKKSKIYLSSLLFCFSIELIMVIAEIIEFMIFCYFYRWHPPIYLPVVLALLATELCLMFTLTSVCLAVLFISTRRALTIIAGFLLAICLVKNLSEPAILILEDFYSLQTEHYDEDRDLFSKAAKARGLNAFYFQIDLSSYNESIFLDGTELFEYEPDNRPQVIRASLLAFIYSDPSLLSGLFANHKTYLNYRDGVMAINIAANIFWTILSNGAALLVLRKKELHG